MSWFRELERLGQFDNQTGFRCGPCVTEEQAESVVSKLVAHIEVLKREWESFSTRVSDPGREDVIRVLPNDLKDFYLGQLLPNQSLLVRAYIGALVRRTRAHYLRLINLSSFEEILAKHFPNASEKRFEVAVLTHQLSSDLQDICAIVHDFSGQGAEQALNDFDTARVVRDQLIPVAGRLLEALPDDYWDDEDIDLPLDVLQMHVAMYERYASHLGSYRLSRSLTDLFSRLESGPNQTAQFLWGVLDYWYDLASDEDRFSDGGNWASEGERHKEKLYALCKAEAVWQLLDKPFFRPEEWQSNLLQLQPIVFGNQRLDQVRRHDVEQIYKSFVFGQWSAVFALARALLEDVVKERLKLAGGELLYDRYGKKQPKDLKWLIDDLVRMRPELEVIRANMDDIREQGNKALHRTFKDIGKSAMVDAEQRFRLSALEVIGQLRLALETLLSTGRSV